MDGKDLKMLDEYGKVRADDGAASEAVVSGLAGWETRERARKGASSAELSRNNGE